MSGSHRSLVATAVLLLGFLVASPSSAHADFPAEAADAQVHWLVDNRPLDRVTLVFAPAVLPFSRAQSVCAADDPCQLLDKAASKACSEAWELAMEAETPEDVQDVIDAVDFCADLTEAYNEHCRPS